ncbi:MAG TPA: tRNA pseudouridine(55) synthase TruB [Rhodospirillaceae bacterium]|nr:tRNA pseudouridine(55) synthase TruB [Rhodospirillaceae bacterium]
MAKRGRPIHGWIAIDKPLGLTSTQVVGRVRRCLDAAKVGHGGTLDPLASGVLPIALGEATKTVSLVMDGAKTYRWRVTWGEQRNTDDAEGLVTATSDHRPTAAAIEAALPAFVGDICQMPPAFSALKIDGRRAYDLARADLPVVLAPRQVHIEHLALLEATADSADFEVSCGKGTYIRALARDLALALGTVGYVTALRRTRCGPFGQAQSISLDKLEEFGHSAAAANFVLPVETALDDIPALALTEDEARRLQSGQSLSISRLALFRDLPTHAAGLTLRAMAGGRLVALARIDGDEIRSVRVLNL